MSVANGTFKRVVVTIDGKKYTLVTWNDEETGKFKTCLFHLNGRKVEKI